jgi:hypothetical protein
VVTLHPQGHVHEGRHKNRIRLEDLKKINKRKFFFLEKNYDEPSHHQMHMVNRKDTRGDCGNLFRTHFFGRTFLTLDRGGICWSV